VVLDFFSRQIVGWSTQPRLAQQLVVDALHMAWLWRRPEPRLIVLGPWKSILQLLVSIDVEGIRPQEFEEA
jgi:transposase InsO family protein